MTRSGVVIMGIFVADMTFRAERQPVMGETLLGSGFALGPGGKGSNQAVAAAKLSGNVTFLTRLGQDTFGDMAQAIWAEVGVEAHVNHREGSPTGAAYIFVEERTGNNAIIVCPGAASDISTDDVIDWSSTISGAAVFMTQFEQPVDAAHMALAVAREASATTILNPAPAVQADPEIWRYCDFATPNETEAAALTGLPVTTIDEARVAGDAMLSKGIGCAVITLGEQGVLVHSQDVSEHVPAFRFGPVSETTGAGDAFNGGFAAALARGERPLEAARFGNAVAGLSITRRGTAASMPTRQEVDAALKGTVS